MPVRTIGIPVTKTPLSQYMKSGTFRIAIIYVIVSLVWIAFSDRILFLFHDSFSPVIFEALNSGKGFFFVIITGAFLHKLISTDQKKMIENAEKTRRTDDEVKRLGQIITKVNNIIIITDKHNFITWVNNAFEDFTGYSLNEVAGYAPATFFAGEETDAEELAAILVKKKAFESFSTNINCHKRGGSRFWVYGEYTPLFDDKKEFTGYIAVYNDITWLKQKEEEITRQNDKLKEIAWLSSHEVRRPVANIIGLANMMKASPLMQEKIRILDNVNRSAEELDQIVHSINSRIDDEIENLHPDK